MIKYFCDRCKNEILLYHISKITVNDHELVGDYCIDCIDEMVKGEFI